MSTVMMIVLFVLSEAVGLAFGEWFFHLLLKAVPPACISSISSQTTRFVYWLYGGGVGLVLFLWALLGMALSRMRQMMSKPAQKS
jgi:hypothetical protein